MSEGLIRQARKARGLSQTQLAARLGVAPQTVSQMELTAAPTIALLARYGAAMGYRLQVRFVNETGGPDIEQENASA
jgi:transcriptional regulator with XRE-family HTH domain